MGIPRCFVAARYGSAERGRGALSGNKETSGMLLVRLQGGKCTTDKNLLAVITQLWQQANSAVPHLWTKMTERADTTRAFIQLQ